MLVVLGIFLLVNPGYLVAYSYIIFGAVLILNNQSDELLRYACTSRTRMETESRTTAGQISPLVEAVSGSNVNRSICRLDT